MMVITVLIIIHLGPRRRARGSALPAPASSPSHVFGFRGSTCIPQVYSCRLLIPAMMFESSAAALDGAPRHIKVTKSTRLNLEVQLCLRVPFRRLADSVTATGPW